MTWFGGKSRVAPLIWERFGNVPNLVDPFFGSGALLFRRPQSHIPFGIETVNDKDSFVSNFFRALKYDPEGVAEHANYPVIESDLHARHIWLVNHKAQLVPRLEGDPDYYDVKIAGWWVYGICSWIGSGFCSGEGPWQSVNGQLVHLGDAGQGVHRKLVHLGNAGRGVQRQLVHLGNAGQGVHRQRESLIAYFAAFAERLRSVRVCCGDWLRVLGESPTTKLGLTGVFLDPPYAADADRDESLYTEEDLTVAHDVRAWAIANGDNPLLRIALCGYDNDPVPERWTRMRWKTSGGYGSQGTGRGRKNSSREVIDFSPFCLATPTQLSLFGDV